MTSSTNGDDFQYDVITGGSASAINVGALALFKKEDSLKSYEFLAQTWGNFKTENLYKAGAKATDQLDTTPLYNFMTKLSSDNGGKKDRKIVLTGAVEDHGVQVQWTEESEDVPKDVAASTAIEFVFKPQVYEYSYIGDGSSNFESNLNAAVSRCTDDVKADESNMILDIIVGNQDLAHQKSYDPMATDRLDDFLRYYESQTNLEVMNAVQNFKSEHPTVQLRYFVQPSAMLESGAKILDAASAKAYLAQGVQDGQAAVGQKEGAAFEQIRKRIVLPFNQTSLKAQAEAFL